MQDEDKDTKHFSSFCILHSSFCIYYRMILPWISLLILARKISIGSLRWRHACGRGLWRSLPARSIFWAKGNCCGGMLEADRLTSVLFYGPPGTGKTTLAQLIATYTKSHFEQVNAAGVGVKEVRAILDRAKEQLANGGKRTVLFLDEIHRFNRAQQDILLPDVEAGLILLVGATTENPFFAVNSPLVSRSQIFQFAPLSEEEIKSLVRRAIADKDRVYGNLSIQVDEDALNLWATISDGDARRALTALEVAVLSSMGAPAGEHRRDADATVITLDIAEQSMQRKAIVYDGTGDEHYDAASALIKSMRGSDPDAAVYWVARMLEAGEDPRFIARRIRDSGQRRHRQCRPARDHGCGGGVRHRRKNRDARGAADAGAGGDLYGHRAQIQRIGQGDLGGHVGCERGANDSGAQASARWSLRRVEAPGQRGWI